MRIEHPDQLITERPSTMTFIDVYGRKKHYENVEYDTLEFARSFFTRMQPGFCEKCPVGQSILQSIGHPATTELEKIFVALKNMLWEVEEQGLTLERREFLKEGSAKVKEAVPTGFPTKIELELL